MATTSPLTWFCSSARSTPDKTVYALVVSFLFVICIQSCSFIPQGKKTWGGSRVQGFKGSRVYLQLLNSPFSSCWNQRRRPIVGLNVLIIIAQHLISNSTIILNIWRKRRKYHVFEERSE